jgi:uncharacterized protein (TIGR02284 family)
MVKEGFSLAEPVCGGSVSGSINQAWTSLKSPVAGTNECTEFNERQRAEDVAKAEYEAAIGRALPPDSGMLVEKQRQRVKAPRSRARSKIRGRMTAGLVRDEALDWNSPLHSQSGGKS